MKKHNIDVIKYKKIYLLVLSVFIVIFIGAYFSEKNILKQKILSVNKLEENKLEITYMINDEIDDKLKVLLIAESSGGIDKIITPDENEISIVNKKKIAIDYEIVRNQQYVFKIKLTGKNEFKEYSLVEDDKVYPIIEQNESYSYPELNDYGVILNKRVDIDFGSNNNNFFSIDNGETWEEYTGTIKIKKPCRLFAKHKGEGNEITKINKKDIVMNIAGDALDTYGYDENEETCAEVSNYETKKIYVDSTMQGKKISMVFSAHNDSWQCPAIGFYSSEGEELEGESYSTIDKNEK